MNPAPSKQRLLSALALSAGLHAFVLFEVGFVLPDPTRLAKSLQPLEVVLVNSRSSSRPDQADALAQANLDGGGNTEQDRIAKSPLPTTPDGKQFTPEQSAQRLRQLEEQARTLMTQIKSTHRVAAERTVKQPGDAVSGDDLLQRSLEIARLEAQISKDYDAYQKLPRRRFIGARTQEFRFAQYVEDWRIKVERLGNLNYPQAARQRKIFGSLVLTVSIRSNGQLENVEVSRSSGKSLLDAAAVRIVRLAAPFAPFPPDIRKDTDILSITRTWMFTESERLESED